jgi:LysR family transcriptional regulator, benzoate and cis,cis-muconate-responsive activator of ben and cat genes
LARWGDRASLLLFLFASITQSDYKRPNTMELRQLTYFIAVAERLSFSKAAQHLHVTVPPLSRQIRQLEDELGAQLLIRDRHGVALTEAGRQLLREASLLMAQASRISDCVRRATRGEAGLLKIGVGFGLGEKISRVLIEHLEKFPAVETHCIDLFSSSQPKALVDGDIDVGFLRPSADDAHLPSEYLFDERLLVHLSKTNPLAGRRSLRMKDIASEPLLIHDRSTASGLYDKTFELYREAGITPEVITLPTDPAPHGDVQTILVACRKGIFIVPDEPVSHPSPDSGVVALPLDEPDAKIEVHAAWRKNEKSPVVLAFLNSVRSVFQPSRARRIAASAATSAAVAALK